jgi:hypothetical protein
MCQKSIDIEILVFKLKLNINGYLEIKRTHQERQMKSKVRWKKKFWTVNKNFAQDIRILG